MTRLILSVLLLGLISSVTPRGPGQAQRWSATKTTPEPSAVIAM
jgi:hypothetical protein